MQSYSKTIAQFLNYCQYQKKLSLKTIQAYTIDLNQYSEYYNKQKDHYEQNWFCKNYLTEYITHLHKTYKSKTVKRKIACLKALFHYLEIEEIIDNNPFNKIQTKFQEESVLPKSIPLKTINKIFTTAYQDLKDEKYSKFKHQSIIRDIAVLELLFATGMRISELCSLKKTDIDLKNHSVRIFGKGSKERIIQIENGQVLKALRIYKSEFSERTQNTDFFFVNRLNHRLSEQSVRAMINRYVSMAGIAMHITPHMFRHSFATLLLEEDVDIRYIQHFLGHASITTTQIYTQVSMSKQKKILSKKHPRNKIEIK